MGPALGLRVCARVEEMSGVSREISFGLAGKKKPPVSPIILIIISVWG